MNFAPPHAHHFHLAIWVCVIVLVVYMIRRFISGWRKSGRLVLEGVAWPQQDLPCEKDMWRHSHKYCIFSTEWDPLSIIIRRIWYLVISPFPPPALL